MKKQKSKNFALHFLHFFLMHFYPKFFFIFSYKPEYWRCDDSVICKKVKMYVVNQQFKILSYKKYFKKKLLEKTQTIIKV